MRNHRYALLLPAVTLAVVALGADAYAMANDTPITPKEACTPCASSHTRATQLTNATVATTSTTTTTTTQPAPTTTTTAPPATTTTAVATGTTSPPSTSAPPATYAADDQLLAQAPAGVVAAFQCIDYRHEAGGNPAAVNPSSGDGGLYQFAVGTWIANGGGQFASRAQYATVAEQDTVAWWTYQRDGFAPWNGDNDCWQ